MPGFRAYRAAEVRALAPGEHDEAIAALAKLTELNTAIQGHVAQVDNIELDMGKLLAMALDRDWARAIYQMTTTEWAAKHLKGRDGYPLGEDATWNLARDWRAISAYPAVEQFVRSGVSLGSKRVTCRTAAYFACEIATLSEWREETLKNKLALLKVLDEATISKAKVDAEAEVNSRVIDMLKRKTATVLRDDYYALKKEIGKLGAGARKIEWVSFKGSVPKEVADSFNDLLVRVAQFADETIDLDEASMTQKIERAAGWGNDAFDAVEAYINGNTAPLQSILEQAKERLK